VVFVLVGDGNDKRALMEKARALGAGNLHFFDPIPKRQIPALLRRFDVAYVGWLRHPLYRFGVFPNKLIDYMMAGRPILHSVEAGNDPVADANCGLTVAPENPGAVADGVLALLAHGAQARDAMGQRGRSYALANLTYPVLGQRFLTALAGEAHHG
jgi:glycosyltransferase involved in cell wall biosynthesis